MPACTRPTLAYECALKDVTTAELNSTIYSDDEDREECWYNLGDCDDCWDYGYEATTTIESRDCPGVEDMLALRRDGDLDVAHWPALASQADTLSVTSWVSLAPGDDMSEVGWENVECNSPRSVASEKSWLLFTQQERASRTKDSFRCALGAIEEGSVTLPQEKRWSGSLKVLPVPQKRRVRVMKGPEDFHSGTDLPWFVHQGQVNVTRSRRRKTACRSRAKRLEKIAASKGSSGRDIVRDTIKVPIWQ